MMETVTLLLLNLAGQLPAAAPPSAEDLEFFEKRVRPVLVERCYECHAGTAKSVQGSLLLDSREAILQGGDTSPAVTPGDVDKSLLITAVRYNNGDLQMPPAGKMPDKEIQAIEEWVRRGAPFPPSESTGPQKRTIDIAAGKQHWAFQPLASPALPDPRETAELHGRMDVFVSATRHAAGLSASQPAERRALIRRVGFDLVGLPPSLEQITAFENDAEPDAYERLVDRYLASPHYGERYGRYWLDLVRYCDVGESWREGEGQPWLYRDWVIRAFNEDLPYTNFVRKQLAADLLPNALPKDNAALGLLGLSPNYWKELKLDHKVIKQVVAEEWEERIEALGGTFLGLTVACARCHDHKFDAITTLDYYGLAGVLANIRVEDRPIIAADLATAAKAARAKVKKLQQELDKLKKEKEQTDELKAKQQELQEQIEAAKQTPHYATPVAPGISDAALLVLPDGEHRTKIEYRPGQMQDVSLHIRGNAGNPGATVPRRFPAVLAADAGARFEQGSGRRELAEAIVTDSAPLAARVIVNRIFANHMGRGLVTTPSNFGTTGDKPSHPELLEELTQQFVTHGWSLKWLHREILASATYRQASFRNIEWYKIDPDNVYLWRMPPRKLEVEAWRDAILAGTGELELTIGGPPVDLAKADNRRRTIYGLVKRRDLNDLLRLHDFPDPVTHSASRAPTTTPLQLLFTLNSPLFFERSRALAARLQASGPADDATRIVWLYEQIYGRRPSEDELQLSRDFFASEKQSSRPTDESWRQYCHALLAGNELLFVE